MTRKETGDTLEVATLPLEDGRRVVVPLQALAEVQQIHETVPDTLSWRGYELPVETLDAACGLAEPPPGRLSVLGVFRAHKDAERPFRALAFCGNPAHRLLDAASMAAEDVPLGEATGFLGATRIQDELCLIPDLQEMLFK